MLKYLIVAGVLMTAAAAERKLSEPVEQGLLYADIPPYVEIEPHRFDSIIEELFIDGDFVIQLTAAYNWGDYAYVYYRSFAGTDSAQQRVLSYYIGELGWAAYIYSDDGTIAAGYRFGVGKKFTVLITIVCGDALFCVETTADDTSTWHTSVIDSAGTHTTVFANEKEFEEAKALREEVVGGIVDSSWLSADEKSLFHKSLKAMALARHLTSPVPAAELEAMRTIAATATVGDATEWKVSLVAVEVGMHMVRTLAHGDWKREYFGEE